MHVIIYFIPFIVIVAGSLTSCKRYTPDAIDFTTENRTWEQTSQNMAGKSPLSLKGAQTIGLFLNPELNKQRAKLKHAKNITLQTGWWQDPDISIDALRILDSTASFKNLISGGAAITLPLSGLPKLEKQIAAQYEEVDYWTLRQQESAFLAQLETAWNNLSTTTRKLEISRARYCELEQETQQLEQLHQAGEVLVLESNQATLRLNDMRHDIQTLEQTAQQQRQQIVSMLGLHPNTANQLQMNTKAPQAHTRIKGASGGDILNSPKLLGQMAKYNTTELELKTEIRRQYPDISLGPVWEHEEDEEKVGFTMGFTLPIWNKNRENIAKSEQARAIAKNEAIQTWRNLYTGSIHNQSLQQTVSQHIANEQKHLDQDKDALTLTAKLHEHGESTLTELAELRQRVYATQMALLDQINTMATLTIQAKYLLFEQ